MGCTYFSGPGFVGHICHGDHWLSLEPFGAKVWVDDHNWLGPTFYRSEAALKVIESPSKKTWGAYEKWRKTLKPNAAMTGPAGVQVHEPVGRHPPGEECNELVE